MGSRSTERERDCSIPEAERVFSDDDGARGYGMLEHLTDDD